MSGGPAPDSLFVLTQSRMPQSLSVRANLRRCRLSPDACWQVSLQLFWFFSYFPEPLSITAQSLIARDMRQPARVQRLAKMLIGIGLVAGTSLALIVVRSPLSLVSHPPAPRSRASPSSRSMGQLEVHGAYYAAWVV
jgi:hypothetical protein